MNARLARFFLPISLLLTLVIVALLISYFDTEIKEDVNSDALTDMSQSLQVAEDVIASELDSYRRHIYYLKSTSVVNNYSQTFLLSSTTADSNLLNTDVQNTFIALMQQHEAIDQLRILSLEKGTELIKVDRNDSGFNRIDANDLQNKGESAYFKESLKLTGDDYYISPITLNKEFGEVELPITPTLRLSLPIQNGDKPKLLLVMNINATFLFEALRQSIDSRFDTYLVNQQDQYLYHPEPEVAFQHELGGARSLRSDFEITTQDNESLSRLVSKQDDAVVSLMLNRPLALKVGGKNTDLTILVALPITYYEDLVQSRSSLLFTLTFIALSVVVALLLFFNLYIRRKNELLSSQSEYKAIIDGTQDGIISVNRKGEVVTINRAALQLLGLGREQVVNQNLDTLPVDIDIDIDDIIKQIQKSNLPLQKYLIYRTKLSVLHLQLLATPIALGNNKVSGIALILRDITTHKEAEHRIRQSNILLEKQVQERTQALEVALEAAEAASHTKSAFISSVSHEMRTPLNGIVGSLELIKKDGLNENQLSYLNLTDISIHNLSNLVNDILDLSKIEAGKLEFREQTIDLMQVIEETLTMFQPIAIEKDLTLLLDLSQLSYHQVRGDGYRVRQVLNNLLSNAAKFTADGFIKVVPSTTIKDNKVIFTCSVQDTGIGIAKHRQRDIFNAFEQENVNTSHTYGGTGLGLSITMQLCQLMNGKVTLESEEGKGSNFTFTVELNPDEEVNTYQIDNLLADVKVALLLNSSDEYSLLMKNVVAFGGEVCSSLDDPSLNIIVIEQLYSNANLIRQEYEKKLGSDVLWIEYGTINQSLRLDIVGRSALLSKPLTMTNFLPIVSAFLPTNLNARNKIKSLEMLGNGTANNMSELQPGRILVVDDNEINLAILRGMLEDTVLTVFTAKNGQEAISFLSKANKSGLNIDLVLMDCNMPVMDGFECTRLIRSGEAGESFRKIHIIAATADAMVGDRERCIEAGMDDYLAKPISKDTLVDKIVNKIN